MHKFYSIIYVLEWIITPFIFLVFFLWKGEFCFMYSCTGSVEQGIVYGLSAVIIYIFLFKIIDGAVKNKRGNKRIGQIFWRLGKFPMGTLYLLVILLIVLVFFLGKLETI